MFKKKSAVQWFSAVMCVALLLASLTLIVGCEGDSAESIIRQIELIIAGTYEHPTAGSTLVARNTGSPITRMTIRQQGDVLEAFDNNGQQFFGTVGRADEETASITLHGPTTAGAEGVITANITVSVGSSDATMRGTWAEPTILSEVFGEATVPVNEVNTNSSGSGSSGSGTDLAISPTSAPVALGASQNFTATGGTPPYSFSLDDGTLGSIVFDANAGTATYTAGGIAGNQTVRVTDDAGDSVSATVDQQ